MARVVYSNKVAVAVVPKVSYYQVQCLQKFTFLKEVMLPERESTGSKAMEIFLRAGSPS